MERPTIVLKVKAKYYRKVLALAMRVYDHLHSNPHYIDPKPALPVLNMHIVELRDAIAKWGPQGNRGSHQDYENLKLRSTLLFNLLRILADYCLYTAGSNRPPGELANVLLSSGFELKRQKAPQGRLEMVQDFHHFIARNIRKGDVKARWKRPLNVRTHTNVVFYEVRRSDKPDFATSVYIGSVTATTFTDTPGNGRWFYWVIPHNYMGAGVTSEMIDVTVC